MRFLLVYLRKLSVSETNSSNDSDLHRFRPEVSIEQASDVTGLVWSHYSCSILSYAFCLASLGHLYSNCSGESARLVTVIKGKVFRQIVRRLPTLGTDVCDEMIPSILCLTSFEVIH